MSLPVFFASPRRFRAATAAARLYLIKAFMAVCALTLLFALPSPAQPLGDFYHHQWAASYTSQGVSGHGFLDNTKMDSVLSDPWLEGSNGGSSYSPRAFGDVDHYSDRPTIAGTVDDGLGSPVTVTGTGFWQTFTCTGTRLIQCDGNSGRIVLDPVSLSALTPTTNTASLDWVGDGYTRVSLEVYRDSRALMNIIPVRVDATSPHSSRIFYRVEPDEAVASCVTF